MKKNALTIFTPTYNRLNTIKRTLESLVRQTRRDFSWLIIDDGSTDGLRQWVGGLGRLVVQEGIAFDWMGRCQNIQTADHFVIAMPLPSADEGVLRIEYVYKPNGGLYTGYNVAYACIDSELCVCIDSDDYLPDDAVETILTTWGKCSLVDKQKMAGIVGLDYNVVDKQPIGGFFPIVPHGLAYASDLHHVGDVKYVFRTDLMKTVAPQIGFEGEKDFNPHYMQMQILDQYPVVVINRNLCWVEYQIGADSMSQAIFKQYVRSAKSYAKYRLMEMQLKRGNSLRNRFRICLHYVSACLFSRDAQWLSRSPLKLLTLMAVPGGVLLNILIRCKAHK